MPKKAKAPKSIVLAPHFEGCENVLFLMAHDDFRFGTPAYKTVTSGHLTTERAIGHNGISCRVFVGDNGKRYHVFPDWSAREE